MGSSHTHGAGARGRTDGAPGESWDRGSTVDMDSELDGGRTASFCLISAHKPTKEP